MRPTARIAIAIGALAVVAGCGAAAQEDADAAPAARATVLVYRLHGAGATVPARALDAADAALRRRLARIGVKGAKVAREGDGRLAVTLPDRATARRLKGTLGQVGLLRFYDWESNVLGADGRPHPTDPAITGGQSAGQPGAGSTTPAKARRVAAHAGQDTVILGAERDAQNPQSVRLARNAVFVLRDRPALTGDDLRHLRASTDAVTGQPNVLFDLTSAGRKRFHALTRRIARRGQEAITPGTPAFAVAHHFAIALDDRLISVPYVNPQQNPDGVDPKVGSHISGNFTSATARDLAGLLAAGPLPARLDLVDERDG